MRGRLVNSVVGGMNLLFGILILAFTFYMPSTKMATDQELAVIKEINTYIFLLMIVIAIINFITLIFNVSDKVLLFGYILAIASSSFYFIDIQFIPVFYILAAALIEIQVLRENMLYINNIAYTATASIVIVAIRISRDKYINIQR